MNVYPKGGTHEKTSFELISGAHPLPDTPAHGGLRLAAAADAQLGQNVAHMGLHRGQLDVQHRADLRVALVGTDEVQDLQLRRRQRFVRRQPRLQKVGIKRRLRPHIRHQALVPLGIPIPCQLFQQGQDRRAVDTDSPDKPKLRRRLQRIAQMLPPPLVPAPVQGDGGEDLQVDAVDMSGAAADIRFQYFAAKIPEAVNSVWQYIRLHSLYLSI